MRGFEDILCIIAWICLKLTSMLENELKMRSDDEKVIFLSNDDDEPHFLAQGKAGMHEKGLDEAIWAAMI